MATGAADANGIWIYGEDDNESTHSALLNKLSNSVSSTVTRLETMTGLNETQKQTAQDNLGIGQVNVIPTSIAYAGTSATVNALGSVTFNGTSVSLNGVFTSAYRNYLVLINRITSSGGGYVHFRYRAGGVDKTAASYMRGGVTQASNGAGIGSWNAELQTFAALFQMDWYSNAVMNVYTNSDNQNRFTCISQSNGGGNRFTSMAGSYDVAGAVDGFTLYASTGTFGGTVQVFGFNE